MTGATHTYIYFEESISKSNQETESFVTRLSQFLRILVIVMGEVFQMTISQVWQKQNCFLWGPAISNTLQMTKCCLLIEL